MLHRPLLVLLLSAACTSTPTDPPPPPTQDAGAQDLGTADAGPADQGAPDTGPSVDLGVDAGAEDAGAQDAGAQDAGGQPNPTYEFAFEDLNVSYMTNYPQGANEERAFPVRAWYPMGFSKAAPVVLVSHGGQGNMTGHRQFQHIAQTLASRGYLSLHINHRPSRNAAFHRWDRPSDVSAVLDGLQSGALLLPAGFSGTADLSRVGHLGHSWGAYTAHAVAGAAFTNPIPGQTDRWNFRDPRVNAIVALSPQGFGGFGAFDEQEDITQPSSDNSWQMIDVPAYCLLGELEKDGIAGIEMGAPDTFRAVDWRLFPFARYPEDGRRYLAVLPGQTHSDLGGGASNEVNGYVAVNARLFFDVYLKGLMEREPRIGQAGPTSVVDTVDHRSK